MKTPSYIIALTIIAVSTGAALTPVANAYVQKLHSEEVQEAFSLGQSTDLDTVTKFFDKYSQQLDCLPGGPCVSSIEFRTPFEEIAVRSRQRGSNYTEQDAEKDYRALPNVVSVRVFVLDPLDFSNDDSDDSAAGEPVKDDAGYSFYGYRIRVSQEHALKPAQVRGKPFYFGGSQCSSCGGEEIILDFNPSELQTDVTHIEILTPDGHPVRAEFNLRNLK